VNGARADDHQQAVILAGHDVVDALRVCVTRVSTLVVLNRKEADEVLGRGQHSNVLDTFVVSLAGFLDASVPSVTAGGEY
jgi:hypothetical protein